MEKISTDNTRWEKMATLRQYIVLDDKMLSVMDNKEFQGKENKNILYLKQSVTALLWSQEINVAR